MQVWYKLGMFKSCLQTSLWLYIMSQMTTRVEVMCFYRPGCCTMIA